MVSFCASILSFLRLLQDVGLTNFDREKKKMFTLVLLCIGALAAAVPATETTPDPLTFNGCDVCVQVVTYAELFFDSVGAKGLKVLLDEVCSLIPIPAFTSVCTSLINNFFDKIVEYLEKKFPPKYICQLIKLCPTTGELPLMLDAEQVCSACNLFIGGMRSTLKSVYGSEHMFMNLCTLEAEGVSQGLCRPESIDSMSMLLNSDIADETICRSMNLCL